MKRTAVLALLALLILVSCQDDQLPTVPQGPMAAISDGAHEDGNPDFFFLPPMVANPVNDPNYDPDGFHPGLFPMVRVLDASQSNLIGCLLDDGQEGMAIAEHVIPADETGKHYQLLLDSDELALAPGNPYRVCVHSSAQGRPLGFLDIVAVDKGAKNAKTGDTYMFQDGRTLPIKFRIEHGALCDNDQDCTEFVMVGSDSADYTVPSEHAGLSLPEGAVAEEDTVTIVMEEQDPPHDDPSTPSGTSCLPPEFGLIQSEGCHSFRTEPPLYEFNEPVRMEACVDVGALLELGVDTSLVRLHKHNESNGLVKLPWVEPELIDCTDYDPYALADGIDQEPAHFAMRALDDLKGLLGEAFLPTPLEATPFAGRVPKGLGGLGTSFSDVGGAVLDAPSGLVSWWTGDNDHRDVYGGNHGTLHNGATYAPGIVGEAFSFDGLDDWVETPSAGLDTLPQFTLETWVKLNEEPLDEIHRFVTLEWDRAVLRHDGPNQLHFYARINGSLQHIWVPGVLQAGCFHHVVGTYDGNEMRAYLDGALVGTLPVTGALDAEESASVTLSHDGPEALNGLLDEVRIYDRALDLTEIESIHAAGDPGLKCQPGEDAETLIGESFATWHRVLSYSGPSMLLSATAFEHGSPWANSGMEHYSRIPRVSSINDPSHNYYRNIANAWRWSYQVLSDVRDGLVQIEGGAVSDPTDELRARAFGKFMQGLAHGTVALLYDQGLIIDESTDPGAATLVDYNTMMTAALGYFTEAIGLAGGGSFTIPAAWMSREVTSQELIRIVRSEMARMRAGVARTPTERGTLDWNTVVADVDGGITTDWSLVSDCDNNTFCDSGIWYRNAPVWNMMANWVHGMADQSGQYQVWLGTPLYDKMPFLLQTPDRRFPQGVTEQAQIDNSGTIFQVAVGGDRSWRRPDRGTWRWSYYRNYDWDWFAGNGNGEVPWLTVGEMQLLKAEAALRSGDNGGAATIVNQTRTAHGLVATDAGGTNGSCVPKLPDGSCGDLWEMLKWEKRLETQFVGALRVGWYFDSRGWGDHMEGTLLHLPVPYEAMQELGQSPYDLGGVGGLSSAPVGTYGFSIPLATATQLVFTIEPAASQVAGVVISPAILVEAQNGAGETDVAYNGYVTLYLASDPTVGSATLLGTTTVQASAGVATFDDISIDVAAAGYTLGVTASSMLRAESSPFDVSPGPPTSLGINEEPGGPAVSGSALPVQPAVALYDAYGNQVPEDGVTVVASIAGGPAGSLSGGSMSTDASGEAAFATITITGDPGTYTIQFSSGVLTPVESGLITVTAAAGSLWTQEPYATTAALEAVWGTAANDVHVAASQHGILHFNGSSWSRVYDAPLSIESPLGVHGAGPTDAFAVGINGHILHYDGAWSNMVAADPPERNLFAVWAAGPTDVFTVGFGGIIRHYDGVWSTQTAGPDNADENLFGIWGSSGGDVFAVGNGGRIMHYDGFGSWSTMTSPTTRTLWGVWGTSGSDVYAVGSGGTILHYNGTIWSESTSPTTEVMTAIWGTSSSDIYVVGGRTAVSPSQIFHFDGANWTDMTPPSTGILRGVWGATNGTVFAVGDGGILLKKSP